MTNPVTDPARRAAAEHLLMQATERGELVDPEETLDFEHHFHLLIADAFAQSPGGRETWAAALDAAERNCQSTRLTYATPATKETTR